MALRLFIWFELSTPEYFHILSINSFSLEILESNRDIWKIIINEYLLGEL